MKIKLEPPHTKASMTSFLKLSLLCLLLFFSIVMFTSSVYANNKYASIVIDAETGMVLSNRHADKILHPASLTKMMTMMMVFDALEQRKISLNDRIRISHHAASMQPSKIGLPAGASIRVDDALKALAVKSANDIAVAVAEFIGGSERNFAKLMTQKAHSIGMKRTRFINASGLHDPRQVSTARDMARLSRYLIYRYANYYHYFSLPKFVYRGKTYTSHNRLMRTYKGMDGLKTGYIAASGFNLAATAKQNNRRIIGVVFGGRSSKTRNAHMKNLLDRGFRTLGKRPARSYSKDSMLFVKAPLPARKPYTPAMLVQNIANITPAAGNVLASARTNIVNSVALNPSNHNNSSPMSLDEYLGQGDMDEVTEARINTALIAISAHTGKEYSVQGVGNYKSGQSNIKKASYTPALKNNNNWTVQLGAFRSRSKTDQVLQTGLSQLPTQLNYGQPIIVPVRVNNAILFRGRLTGYSEDHAKLICAKIKNCNVIAPQ